MQIGIIYILITLQLLQIQTSKQITVILWQDGTEILIITHVKIEVFKDKLNK